MTDHRWSGWPGAWCLDCGASDVTEQCLADHGDEWNPETGSTCTRPECRNGPCPEPGCRHYDPYSGAGCPQTGNGGWHSAAYYDDGSCAWCGMLPAGDTTIGALEPLP